MTTGKSEVKQSHVKNKEQLLALCLQPSRQNAEPLLSAAPVVVGCFGKETEIGGRSQHLSGGWVREGLVFLVTSQRADFQQRVRENIVK